MLEGKNNKSMKFFLTDYQCVTSQFQEKALFFEKQVKQNRFFYVYIVEENKL